MTRTAVLGLIATICLASVASAGDVAVRALGLRSDAGELRVAICTEETFLAPRCERGGAAPAHAGTVILAKVPPGRYAVQAHHDENGNGRLDRTRLGRPAEGLGFSRDAPMRFGAPRFSDAVVEVPPGGGTVSLTMRYFR